VSSETAVVRMPTVGFIYLGSAVRCLVAAIPATAEIHASCFFSSGCG